MQCTRLLLASLLACLLACFLARQPSRCRIIAPTIAQSSSGLPLAGGKSRPCRCRLPASFIGLVILTFSSRLAHSRTSRQAANAAPVELIQRGLKCRLAGHLTTWTRNEMDEISCVWKLLEAMARVLHAHCFLNRLDALAMQN